MNDEIIRNDFEGGAAAPSAGSASEGVLTPAAPVEEEGHTHFVKYEEPHGWKLQKKRFMKYRKVLWFILPAAFFSFFFSYIPMLGLLFAFKDSSFNLLHGNVVGELFRGAWTFQNFADIFVDNSVFLALGNTLLINVIRLALCFPLSIILAIQLADMRKQGLSKLVLIILCIPNFLSWAIVISTWSGLFDSQGGVLNEVFVKLGWIEPDYFLMGKDHMFKFFVIFLSAWKGTGWGSIMFYSAVMAIDKSFYESATLEGANKLQKAWYLTIPSITPTIALMLVMNISSMMGVGFEQVYTMMQLNSSLEDTQITLDVYIYNISMDNTNIPYATAVGVVNGLVGLVLMIVGNKITTKTLHRSLW